MNYDDANWGESTSLNDALIILLLIVCNLTCDKMRHSDNWNLENKIFSYNSNLT